VISGLSSTTPFLFKPLFILLKPFPALDAMAPSFNEERANQLEQEGRNLADAGRTDEALQRYHRG